MDSETINNVLKNMFESVQVLSTVLNSLEIVK